MTMAESWMVAGGFVVARVGVHALGVSVDYVAGLLDRNNAEDDTRLEIETVLDTGPVSHTDRILLRLKLRGSSAALEVPGDRLEVGRHLDGRCHAPRLIARALERCCLRGAVIDGDRLVYVLDVDQMWEKFVRAPLKGEPT